MTREVELSHCIASCLGHACNSASADYHKQSDSPRRSQTVRVCATRHESFASLSATLILNFDSKRFLHLPQLRPSTLQLQQVASNSASESKFKIALIVEASPFLISSQAGPRIDSQSRNSATPVNTTRELTTSRLFPNRS